MLTGRCHGLHPRHSVFHCRFWSVGRSVGRSLARSVEPLFSIPRIQPRLTHAIGFRPHARPNRTVTVARSFWLAARGVVLASSNGVIVAKRSLTAYRVSYHRSRFRNARFLETDDSVGRFRHFRRRTVDLSEDEAEAAFRSKPPVLVESLDDVRRTIRSIGGTKVREREIVGKRARRGEARRYIVLAKQRNAFGKSIASRNIQGSSVAEHNGALLERR